MKALIDFGNKVKTIQPAYAIKLSFCTRKVDVGTEKINGSYLDIFVIVTADCSVKDRLKTVRFFQQIFLLANISLEIVLEMLFLTFSRQIYNVQSGNFSEQPI